MRKSKEENDYTAIKNELLESLRGIAFMPDEEVKCSERLKAIELLCKITGIMNGEEQTAETIEQYLRRCMK